MPRFLDGGCLPVADYLTRDEEAPVWTVYGRTGQRLGIVRLPPRSRLMDATSEELLVVQEAEERHKGGGER